MKALLILLILLVSLIHTNALAGDPVIVAVIDTGFGYGVKDDPHLCKCGHRDFSVEDKYFYTRNGSQVPLDINGHGTNVVGLIEKYADQGSLNYCIVVIKFYSENKGNDNMVTSLESIMYAYRIGAKIINYSAGGPVINKREATIIKKFLDDGGIFVAAAGNDDRGLDMVPYYPAMDDPRVTVVGNMNDDGSLAQSSNFGTPVKYWEVGQQVEAYGIVRSGTSQAAAIHTGKILSKMRN